MFKEVVFVVSGMFFFLMLENASSQSGGLHGSGDNGKVLRRFKPWNGLTSLSKLKEKSTCIKGKEGKGCRNGKDTRPKTVPKTSESSTPPLTTQPTAAPTNSAESSTAPTDVQKTPKLSPGFYEVPAAFGKGNKHGNKFKPPQSSSWNDARAGTTIGAGDYSPAFKREGRSMNLKNNPDALLGNTKVKTGIEPTRSSSSNDNEDSAIPKRPGDYSFAFKRDGRYTKPGAQLGNKRRKIRIKGKKRKDRKPEEDGFYQDKKLPGDYGDFFILGNNTDNATEHKNDEVKPDRVKIPAPSFQSKKPVKPIGGGHFSKPLVIGNYIAALPFGRNRVVRPLNKSRAKKNKKEEPNKTYQKFDDE